MITIDFLNSILALIGERSLTSSSGSLGTLVRSMTEAALLKVVQETRANFFQQRITMTATFADYTIAAGNIPTDVIQIYDCFLFDPTAYPTMQRMSKHPFSALTFNLGYAIEGDKVYISPAFVRPTTLVMNALVLPIIPADGALLGLPTAVVPAIRHTAAAMMLVSYLDDSNAASIQQNIADSMIVNLRSHFGKGREVTRWRVS